MTSPIPHDGYWRIAGQIWFYPLVTVFAKSKAEADIIAGPDRLDGTLYFLTAMDSTDAAGRLGLWARPDLAAKMMRGDSR